MKSLMKDKKEDEKNYRCKKVLAVKTYGKEAIGVGTSGSKRCHLHEGKAQDALDRPVVEKTTTTSTIQAQIAPSLGALVSSRNIRRRLAEGHLGSRRPLRVLPLMPTHRLLRLEWCRARGNWTAVEWNQVVFSDESRFNFSSDDNRARAWRPRGKHLNPTFGLQRHTAPTAGVMVCLDIAYNTRSFLVLIHGTMTSQRYVHDILQPHVLQLMQLLP
ncbi:transposable element Tcb1 transposase [Trichonephila clavipes]|nr:transposable element Tcb1 transposase [Trichonephila clavipes]